VYLQDFIADKSVILADAMKHPAMVAKRKPTIETAMKCVVSTLEMYVASAVTDKYKPIFQDAFDMYEIDNGEYDTLDAEAKDNWSEGMDSQVEQLIEPLTQYLSANWLGINTIDTRLWEPGAVDKLAQSLGKEIFKNLAYGKEPGQVLSNAGIVRDDIDAVYAEHMKPKSQEDKAAMASEVQTKLSDVIASIYAQVGAGYDVMQVQEDLEGICDDDEILAGSAGQRLGLSQEDLNVVQLHVLDVGVAAAAEEMGEMLAAYKPDTKPTKAASAPAAAPAAPGTPPAPTPVTATPAGSFPASTILALVKAHSGVKEAELATELGVSRSTFINWTSGKTQWSPDAAQRETLRNRVVADLNGLNEALAAIDGVEVDRVYE